MKAYVVMRDDGLLARWGMADRLFEADVCKVDVTMQDWRAGDLAPHGGIRIALHARLSERSR